MTTPILSAHNLRKVVRDGDSSATILDGIDLQVSPGECLALLGASGSGKSTLLHILGALDPDYQGELKIGGQSLGKLSDAALSEFRNRTVGFVFQAYNLIGHLNALENVLLPARFSSQKPNHQRAHEILDSVGLASKAHRKPQSLSGGERQRVAIARALYHQPKIVFCDEPTGNLDGRTGAEILALFDRLLEQGTTLVIATHDDAISARASRILHLVDGRLNGEAP